MSTPEQGAAGAPPSEEELRAYEAELARISTTDVIMQMSVSLLNLGARRLGSPASQAAAGAAAAGERDLEQVRDAIDSIRALLSILERRVPNEVTPLRDALSQLQMAYAREVGGAGADTGGGGGPGEPGGASGGAGSGPAAGKPEGEQQRRPGPAESSGRLWVPGQ